MFMHSWVKPALCKGFVVNTYQDYIVTTISAVSSAVIFGAFTQNALHGLMDISNKMTGNVVALTQKASIQEIKADKVMTKDWQPELALYAKSTSAIDENF